MCVRRMTVSVGRWIARQTCHTQTAVDVLGHCAHIARTVGSIQHVVLACFIWLVRRNACIGLGATAQQAACQIRLVYYFKLIRL